MANSSSSGPVVLVIVAGLMVLGVSAGAFFFLAAEVGPPEAMPVAHAPVEVRAIQSPLPVPAPSVAEPLILDAPEPAPAGDEVASDGTITLNSTVRPAGGAREPDVDCLLDPNLPKCSGAPSPEPDSSLPKRLTASDIVRALGGVKPAVKRCGSGAIVSVKYSIEGATGKVLSVQVQGEHASSSVGQCVAAEAKKAEFVRFQAERQGFTYKFRL